MPALPLDTWIRLVVLHECGCRGRAPDDVIALRLRFKLSVQFY